MDGSSDELCIAFLRNVRDKFGVNVIFLESNLNELESEMTHVMGSLTSSSDLMIKLDTDEFIALFDDDPICLDPNYSGNKCYLTPYGVQDYIDSPEFPLDGSGSRLKASYTIQSVPNKAICKRKNAGNSLYKFTFTPAQKTDFKSFFDSRTFRSVDLGSHGGSTLFDTNKNQLLKPAKETRIGIVHFHYRCYSNFMASNRQAVIRHGYMSNDDNDEEAMAKLKRIIPRSIPTRANDCSEPMIGCPVSSCHKVYHVLQDLVCKDLMEDEYYDRNTPFSGETAPLQEYLQFVARKYKIYR